MSETTQKPKSKVDEFVDKVRRTHVPDEAMNCKGCNDENWPCDAANLLIVIDRVVAQADATFANNTAMIRQLLDLEDVLNPLLGGDLSLDYQPAVYLDEAEEVGGRSKWAMRYADEAQQFKHYKTRAERKFAKIREVLGRTRVR